MIRFLGIAAALTLAACSGTSTLLQYTPAQSDLRLQANVSSVMVQTVTLPSYAASEEIAVEIEPGIIETSSDFLWADQPERAVTLALTANLNDILGTTVGANPWPFPGLPDAAVDVRVSEMVAGVDGNFRLTGQFYTGGDGIDYPNRSERFAIAVPILGEGVTAISAAQARAIVDLSERVARNLGR
jgi:uncharacterized lipoprotein YmbA